jgi:hypothetical protein
VVVVVEVVEVVAAWRRARCQVVYGVYGRMTMTRWTTMWRSGRYDAATTATPTLITTTTMYSAAPTVQRVAALRLFHLQPCRRTRSLRAAAGVVVVVVLAGTAVVSV